jgi:hypothetical protein
MTVRYTVIFRVIKIISFLCVMKMLKEAKPHYAMSHMVLNIYTHCDNKNFKSILNSLCF